MLSRLVSFSLLIAASLFLWYAYIIDAPPLVLTNALLVKTVITSRVPTSASFPRSSFSAGPFGASSAYNSIIVDHAPSGSVGRIVTETLPPSTDLAIQISGPGQVNPGGTVSYTLTIRNQGPIQATGILLTNVLSKGVTPVGTRPAQPWCDRNERSTSCTIGDVRPSDTTSITLDLSVGGTQTHVTNTQLAGVTLDLSSPTCTIDLSQFSVTCHLAELPAGADAQIRVDAELDAQIAGTLINSATITANETDPDPSNNRATLVMTVGAAMPVTNQPVPTTIDLVVQADGPSSVVAGQPFTYTYTIANRGELDATGVHFEDTLPSTANLYSYSPGLPKCEQQGNVLSCWLHDPESGETVTFTLTITGSIGQPVRINPDQPMPGWPICTVLKERTWLRIVNCELGTLKRGQITHVQLGLVAIGVVEGRMTNSASVRARETDLNSGDNVITATMTVQVRSDLSIQSTVAGPAIAGRPMSYTLTVANDGPSDADSVVLTDTLPMNTRLISATPSQGNDCQVERKDATAPGTVVCHLGAMSGGRTATVMIALAADESLTPDLAKMITHFAKVISGQTDPNLSNNEFLETIPVGAGAKD